MYVIHAKHPDEGLYRGLRALASDSAFNNDSRNGRVVQVYCPVTTVYSEPQQRVIFNPLRDANPFFHLFEALWMLAGRNDVAKIANYAKQMESFAEDDGLQWGAYGYRWRHHFEFDQLESAIAQLRRDPNTRRVVMAMWDPVGDVEAVREGAVSGRDIPCNTHLYFNGTSGLLDMTVCNRSNDAVWGCYGANVVHMSMLHEFVARSVGLPLGTYYQISNNFHAYVDRPDVSRLFDEAGNLLLDGGSPYDNDAVQAHPLMHPDSTPESWLSDCELFVSNPVWFRGVADPFFTDVAAPMMRAHAAHKGGDRRAALLEVRRVKATDWQRAGLEWLERRYAAKVAS